MGLTDVLVSLSVMISFLHLGMAAGARVLEYIALEPSIPERGGRIIPFRSLLGDVEFRNVHFSYSTRPEQVILRGFNLRIPPGRVCTNKGFFLSKLLTIIFFAKNDVNF